MITLLLVVVLLSIHTLWLYSGRRDDTLTQKWRLLRRSFYDDTFDRNYSFYCCQGPSVPLAAPYDGI